MTDRKEKGMKRTPITDKELEELGLLSSRMCADCEQAWLLAMKTLPLGSVAFRRIERSKKQHEVLRLPLFDMAWDRQWPPDRINAVFAVRTLTEDQEALRTHLLVEHGLQ